jgi:hypothetical protein
MSSLTWQPGSTPPFDWSDGCAIKPPSKAAGELTEHVNGEGQHQIVSLFVLERIQTDQLILY